MSGPAPQGGLEARFSGRLGGFELDADFAMPPQGVTALIGPSGAGKTSLLRCVAGLTRLPGRLVVDGEVWQDKRAFLAPHRRPVGLVFQDASLLAHLSVRDNLLYGQRRTTAPRTIQLEGVVDLLGLASLLTRSTAHLSGGERQRVALGRALLSQPRLLLMDEPLSSLDADSKAEILPYLERLHQALAIPILYVSHDVEEVRRLADHVLVMRGGRIIQAMKAVKSAAEVEQAAWRLSAEQQLADLAPEQVRRLALAALLAGLPPA